MSKRLEDKISLKLISEILRKDISGFNIVGDSIHYFIENYESEEDGELVYIDLGLSISLDTFLSKAKDWLFNSHNIMFDIRYRTNSSRRNITIIAYGIDSSFYYGATELEAIIELCNYVLTKNKGK